MRNRYTNVGWLVTIIIAITPIVLWLIAAPMGWDSLKNVSENLGKLAGLSGLALFAWAVILSARLKIYNKLFMGLDNTYRAHHIIGSLAFIFLLIHPVLITFRYFLSSPLSAYEFLKPSLASPFRSLGSIALFSMVVLLGITLYINVKHEKFVLAQRLLGFVLFVGAIHAVFVGNSDLGFSAIGILSLQVYMLSLVFIAAAVYVYRSIFHGNFAKYYNYTVDSTVTSGDNYELILTTNDKKMDYLPGQFSFIKLEAEGILGQTHPFSMTSNPGEDKLSFGIKTLGDYTAELATVKKGTNAKIDGPYGTFSNKILKASRQVWIAGGIGVTPFVSMSKALDSDQIVDLYYSAKNIKEAFYLEELNKISKSNNNLKIIPFIEDKVGYITAEYIFKNSNNIDNANFMICGPAIMMKSIRKQLKDHGVKKKSINTEEFNLS
jgi:predicted ferric reductase